MYHEEKTRVILPVAIAAVSFGGPRTDGEKLTVEVRRVSEDGDGALWDAQALDPAGAPAMQVRGLRMRSVAAETLAPPEPTQA
jgi:hypothetical protein